MAESAKPASSRELCLTELVGEAVVGTAVVGDAVVGTAVVGDDVVGDALVGDDVVTGFGMHLQILFMPG